MSDGDSDENWFEKASTEDGLEQGDLLFNFPVVRVLGVVEDIEKPRIAVDRSDVIVLTQTCDIPKVSQPSILLAQVSSYEALCDTGPPDAKSKSFRKKLYEGTQGAMFLLHEYSGTPYLPWSVVSFRNLFLSSKQDVELFAKEPDQRLRLASPYKEHLSQAYARFMMRVGLPTTAVKFVDYEPPKQ